MAFFGLTFLGYENPIEDKMIVSRRGASGRAGVGLTMTAGMPPALQEEQGRLGCTDMCSVYHQPLPYSTDIHHGSHERYKEMVKRVQTPRSPDQLYIMPVTNNQQYGWMLSKSSEPWTKIKRFPRKNSEITRFVKEMSAKDGEFSMF